jgi:hypothetical protein
MTSIVDADVHRPGFFRGVGLGPIGYLLAEAGWLEERDYWWERDAESRFGRVYGRHHIALFHARCPVGGCPATYQRGARVESIQCDEGHSHDPDGEPREEFMPEAWNAFARELRPESEIEWAIDDLQEVAAQHEQAFDFRCSLATVPGIRQRGSELVIAGAAIEPVRRGALEALGFSSRTEREILAMGAWAHLGVLALTDTEAFAAQAPFAELAEVLFRHRRPMSSARLLADHRSAVERLFRLLGRGAPDTRSLGRVLATHGHAVGIVQRGRNGDGATWGVAPSFPSDGRRDAVDVLRASA